MEESDFEIVRAPAAVGRIFELMLERRKPLSLVQHGQRSDAWVVKVHPDRLILAKRDKASHFTAEAVEFQFRCVLGRNIAGKTRIIRLNDDYLEIALPPQVTIIQRRHAYRVVPTVDSTASFLLDDDMPVSGRIDDISSRGLLVRVPQATPIILPCDISDLTLHLNHAPAPGESGARVKGAAESLQLIIPEAVIVRKADRGTTKFASYGIHFTPNIALERQLVQIILRFERAARQKGLTA